MQKLKYLDNKAKILSKQTPIILLLLFKDNLCNTYQRLVFFNNENNNSIANKILLRPSFKSILFQLTKTQVYSYFVHSNNFIFRKSSRMYSSNRTIYLELIVIDRLGNRRIVNMQNYSRFLLMGLKYKVFSEKHNYTQLLQSLDDFHI